MAKKVTRPKNDDDGKSKPRLDPIIQGLFARLPPSGDEWPEAERRVWLQLIEAAFKVVYESDQANPAPHSTPAPSSVVP